MANTSSAFVPRDLTLTKPNVRTERGLFSRLIEAMMASRQRSGRARNRAPFSIKSAALVRSLQRN